MKSLGLIAFFIFCSVVHGEEKSSEAYHYVFFNRDRERIAGKSFLSTRAFEGAQLKYTWRELEPGRDEYNFSSIRHDLEFLIRNQKKLFIQIQEASFDPAIVNVPKYLVAEAEFNGGASEQYIVEGETDSNAKPAGWVARRWDPAVQKRFHLLLNALGKEFDGRIEGINLPEASVDFGETGRLYPKGFTPAIYLAAIVTNMAVAKAAFPKSIALQYANFMPGEWLPENDHGLLRTVFARAKELKVGVGGPDLLPYKPGQMKHSYPLIRELAGTVPTGIAVQWGNYEHRNPKNGAQVAIADLIQFAQDYLKVNYIFWCTQEPYYSEKVIPFLKKGHP